MAAGRFVAVRFDGGGLLKVKSCKSQPQPFGCLSQSPAESQGPRMVCASLPARVVGRADVREISRRLSAVARHQRWGISRPGKLPRVYFGSGCCQQRHSLSRPLSTTRIANRRKPWHNPADRSSAVFALSYKQLNLLLSTCSAMDRRTYEGPMDWEYQSQPPVDHSSPFAKFSQKQPTCMSWILLFLLLPVVFQHSAAQSSVTPPTFSRTAHHSEY